jgi:hypothetical protein
LPTFAVNNLRLPRLASTWHTGPVRWSRLFADLDGQLESADQAARAAEAADLRRLEVSRLTLADRLRGSVGSTVGLAVEGVGPLTCTVTQVGAGWLLATNEAGIEVVVALQAVASVTGLPAAAASPGDQVDEGLGLGFVLRRLARDRAAVTVSVRTGESFTGTVDRVGADFLDLAEHAADRPRRAAEVRRVRTIAVGALAVVRPA